MSRHFKSHNWKLKPQNALYWVFLTFSLNPTIGS